MKNQHKQLRHTEDQLTTTKEQIRTLKKKLEEAESVVEKAKQEGYDIVVAETEENLRAEVSGVYRNYCLQVWNEALNQARVDASSTLRRVENVYHPSAILASGPSSSKAKAALKKPKSNKNIFANALTSSTIPLEVVVQAGTTKKEKETTKEVAPKATKLPLAPKDSSKEKGVSQSQELVPMTLLFTAKEDPKGKGSASSVAVPELPTKAIAKANPPIKTK